MSGAGPSAKSAESTASEAPPASVGVEPAAHSAPRIGTLGLDLDATLIRGPLGSVIADLDAQVAREQGITGLHDQVMTEAQRLLTEDPAAAYDWQSILDRVARERAADLPFDIVERLEEVAPARTRLLEDEAPEVLQRLKAEGWRLVVITNGWHRYQVPALRAVGLLDLVDELVTADSAGAPKPDPAMFQAAMSGSGPLVHLGDRLDDDVLGARSAGGAAILYCPTAPAALQSGVGGASDVPAWPTAADEDPCTRFLSDLAARQQARVDPGDPLARPDAVISGIGDLPASLRGLARR